MVLNINILNSKYHQVGLSIQKNIPVGQIYEYRSIPSPPVDF